MNLAQPFPLGFVCFLKLPPLASPGLIVGMLPRSLFQEHRFKSVTAVTASKMLSHRPLQELRQECYRSCRFKNVTAASALYCIHRFKNVTVVTANASRMLPLSPLQECYSMHSPLQDCYRSTASRMFPMVMVSKILPRAPVQE